MPKEFTAYVCRRESACESDFGGKTFWRFDRDEVVKHEREAHGIEEVPNGSA